MLWKWSGTYELKNASFENIGIAKAQLSYRELNWSAWAAQRHIRVENVCFE